MRWFIVFEILLTLSINNFALTAPVLVQEKRHACVDAVHVPKDVVTVLEKRVDEFSELVKEYTDFFKEADLQAQATPSLAPLSWPGDVSAGMHTPAPNPASSTANPDPLMEPSSPSSAESSTKGGTDNLNKPEKEYFNFFKAADAHAPSSSSSAPPDPLSLSLGLPSTGSSMKGVTDNLNNPEKEYFDFFKAADAHAPSSSSSAPPDPLGLSLGLPSTGSSMKWVTDSLNTGQKSVKSPKPPSLPPPAPLGDAGLPEKWWYNGPDGPMYTPMSLSGPDRESTGVHALQPPPSKRPRLGLGSKLDVPAPAPNLASPTVNLAPLAKLPSVASTASPIEPGGYYSYRLAALEAGTKPLKWWDLWSGLRPKSPELPTVPEQEVTSPLPNPSSPKN